MKKGTVLLGCEESEGKNMSDALPSEKRDWLMDNAFKPKYTMGYWAGLFFPALAYLLPTSSFLSNIEISRKVAARFNLPYEGFGSADQLLVLLLGILVLLRFVSNIVNGHVRKVEVNSEGIVFRRLIGKSIIADQRLAWSEYNFKVGKYFEVSPNNITNRDAMKEFLGEQLISCRQEAKDESEKQKSTKTWLGYLMAAFFMLGFCAIIGLTFLPWDSYNTLNDTAVWYVDGVVAFLLLIYAGSIIRKALHSH